MYRLHFFVKNDFLNLFILYAKIKIRIEMETVVLFYKYSIIWDSSGIYFRVIPISTEKDFFAVCFLLEIASLNVILRDEY